jgi:hypothetical protein
MAWNMIIRMVQTCSDLWSLTLRKMGQTDKGPNAQMALSLRVGLSPDPGPTDLAA